MVARKDRSQRLARERSRVYIARQAFHEGQMKRRRRDNLILGIAGGVLILGIVGTQTAYYTVGPAAAGSPSPTPTASPTYDIPGPAATSAP